MRVLPPALFLLERRIRHAASRLGHSTDSTTSHPQEDANNHELFPSWINCIRNGICSRELLLNDSSVELTIRDDGIPFSTILNRSETVNNDTTDEQDDVRELYRIVVPVMLTACVISMLFNLVIVFSVRWVRRSLSPTLYLSLSLAVADAYASLVLGLGLVVNSLLPNVYDLNLGTYTLCYVLVLEAFRLGGVVVAVLHLLALAVNHYIGILRPLHYAATVTRRTAVCAIITMWLLPVTFFLAYFSLVPNDGFRSSYCSSYNFLLHRPFRLTTSLLFFLPLLLMSVMYVHMFVVVRRHQQGLLQLPSTRQLHKNVKAIITTLLILGTYVLGWMPAVLYFILTCLDCPVPFDQIQLWVRVPVGIFINSMIVAKSFVDPVIYVVRMPEIKNALRSIWKTRCGLMNGEAMDQNMHSRSDVNRLTFLMASRKTKHNNGLNDLHNDKGLHHT